MSPIFVATVAAVLKPAKLLCQSPALRPPRVRRVATPRPAQATRLPVSRARRLTVQVVRRRALLQVVPQAAPLVAVQTPLRLAAQAVVGRQRLQVGRQAARLPTLENDSKYVRSSDRTDCQCRALRQLVIKMASLSPTCDF